MGRTTPTNTAGFMATYQINVPESEDVKMKVGDTLEITFTEACRFCSPADAATYFSPALPDGKQKEDDVWSGVAQSAALDQTFDHHSVAHDATCDSKKKRSATHSVQIGSGKP
jgi:hypothetical protein